MDQSTIINNNYSRSFINRLKENLYRWIRLSNKPVIKVYHGYGNADELVVFGHVLALSPLPRKKYRKNIWTNTLALVRLFMVQPLSMVSVEAHFNGQIIGGTAEKDGFFRFQWKPLVMPEAGWHAIEVFLSEGVVKKYYGIVKGVGEIFIPSDGEYAIISDIDDTFLISYSSNLRKRLYVLLTENAHSRKPFEGVVRHYQSLEFAGENMRHPNPFFYVSSSEWNLYEYIRDFSKKNILPKGIYLLNRMKNFSQAWKTGQNNHSTKFMRISRVIQAFPGRQFILLGDDSQQDPVIYASVVEHFPGQVKAVYLRNVYHKNRVMVDVSIQKMEGAGIAVCHFQHSRQAIEHSKKIGLIQTF